MSLSGGIMTRRQFNPDLLPKVPPKKEKTKGCRNTNKRFPEIKNFFALYISLSRGKWNRKEMAAFIDYSTQSVSHWRYGTPPGKLSHRKIAKYFSTITGISSVLILSDLEYAYSEGWRNYMLDHYEGNKKKETE